MTGGGGFIGHHLVNYLVGLGDWVRAVDVKVPEYAPTRAHEFELLDLRRSSSCYVDDCVEGIYRLMRSDYAEPLNLGSDRPVTINELVDLVARIAAKNIRHRHDLSKPQGVRGRNSDNARLSGRLHTKLAVAS